MKKRRLPRIKFCAVTDVPVLLHSLTSIVADEAALAFVREMNASQQVLTMVELIAGGEPVLLRKAWQPATELWSWERLGKLLRGKLLQDVLLTDDNYYMPADAKAKLSSLVQSRFSTATHALRNLSADAVVAGLQSLTALERQLEADSCGSATRRRDFWRHLDVSKPFSGRRLIWFGDLPDPLRSEVQPKAAALYASDYDAGKALQYAWISSPGARTHTHFDNDHNSFVQLIGTKRFLLWPPNQTVNLCPFPRLHPLWHKSRMDFERPRMEKRGPCATYGRSEALGVTVRPGDTLYIPPFWWHTVETLSPSLSLSTLSRWPQLYNHLNGLYRHDYIFDALRPHGSRVYALRAFLAELLRKAGRPNFISEALLTQYAGLEHHFPAPRNSSRRQPSACQFDERGTPICRWCLSRVRFEVELAWDEHLMALPADVRTTALSEFVEEVTAEAVGASESLRFWQDCFGPEAPRFFLTTPNSEEHRILWITRDQEDGF